MVVIPKYSPAHFCNKEGRNPGVFTTAIFQNAGHFNFIFCHLKVSTCTNNGQATWMQQRNGGCQWRLLSCYANNANSGIISCNCNKVPNTGLQNRWIRGWLQTPSGIFATPTEMLNTRPRIFCRCEGCWSRSHNWVMIDTFIGYITPAWDMISVEEFKAQNPSVGWGSIASPHSPLPEIGEAIGGGA